MSVANFTQTNCTIIDIGIATCVEGDTGFV